MFTDLINAWKQVYATYLEGGIHKVMYYYLTLVIIVVGGLYVYLYYSGCLGLAILFSSLAGAQPSGTQPPITIVQSIGIILIVRYTFLGALDMIAKKAPDQMLERLSQVEDKIRDLHQLAFTGFMEEKRITEVKKEIKRDKVDAKKKAKAVKK